MLVYLLVSYWQACHCFRKCEYEYLSLCKCTNYRRSIFDLWTRVTTRGVSSHALRYRFFTWHIFVLKTFFVHQLLSFGKIWPVSREYFSTNTCQVTLWHLCMTCLSDLLSNMPWWLKDNAVNEWICTANSRSGLTYVLTYHTGRHPLGKIREETGNIQNY